MNMTPTIQDLTLARGYGMAIDLLLSLLSVDETSYQASFNGLLDVVTKEIDTQNLSLETQLLSIIASCQAESSDKRELAIQVLRDGKSHDLEVRFAGELFGVSPYCHFDDNLPVLQHYDEVLKDIRAHPERARLLLHSMQVSLDALAHDVLLYDRLMS